MKALHKRILPILLLFATAFAATPPLAGDTSVTLLHSNDTHAHIMPFDSKAYGPETGGIARRANLIRKLKAQTPYALVLDAGDIFQGTPFYSIFKGEACHKLAVAAGYEAVTIGNHELDNSLENLQTQVANSGIRLLCCNVFYRDSKRPIFPGYQIFLRNGLKIAVIGSIGNEAWEVIDRKIRAPLFQTDQTTAVRQVAQRLRKYVDLIVVLSHAGIEFDEQMAAQIAEIDVIIGGHTHEEILEPRLIHNNPEIGVCNNGLDGTIVVQAGEHGTFLGKLDLLIDDNGQISNYNGQLIKITSEHEPPPGDQLLELVSRYNHQLEQQMGTVAGFTDKDLSLTKDLKKTHILTMGTFTAQSMLEAGKGDICVVNSGAIKTGIEAGEITIGEIYEALPYDNTVVTFTMSGKDVQAMFDFICSNKTPPDGYQYAGMNAELDMVKGQAKNILIGGQPLDAEKKYRVSTSSFMANGNIDGDKLFAKVESVEDSGVFMRDAAINYLGRVKTVPDYSRSAVNIIRD
ncbi:MAG: bifunctional metallophosphatase/5'-nucleotidase [Candidatus Riflebacteria bacterium]|nr:bifunctional metallophosphatase/5'-nucleotidase [Candidatus Riflebacteria bacterium]